MWGSWYSIFSSMCMLCRSLFVLLYFFFWPLCCLLFFDIRILIATLVSSNSFTTSGTYPWSFVTQIFHNGPPSHVGDRKIFEVITSTLPKGTLGSVASLLAATLYQGNIYPLPTLTRKLRFFNIYLFTIYKVHPNPILFDIIKFYSTESVFKIIWMVCIELWEVWSLWYATHRLMVMHPHTTYNWPIWKDKKVMVRRSFAEKKRKRKQKKISD
jgi:hypothetical protein